MVNSPGNRPATERRRICFVVSSPLTVRAFLMPHIRELVPHMSISLIGNGVQRELFTELDPLGVETIDVAIARRPNPIADLRVLQRLHHLIRARGFDAVLSVTPKAGLLGMLAAKRAGVTVRVHWFTGQVWATRTGLTRRVLRALDRVTCRCATHPLADSMSQRVFLEQENVADSGRVGVLCDGSISGVDTDRFRPDASRRAEFRTKLGIPAAAVVFLFLGRVTREKGIPELAEAFARLAKTLTDVHLLVVGPHEDRDCVERLARLQSASHRVHLLGPTHEPEIPLAAADVLVLPSWREGFGTTVLEAAASEVPTIATRIYGVTDAVAENSTGLLVPVGDIEALSMSMRAIATEPCLRNDLARAARARVLERFQTARLTAALRQHLQQAMQVHACHPGPQIHRTGGEIRHP